MTAFSEQWLQLREPLDAASRAATLIDTLAGLLPARPLRAIDLATGTGTNLRYLAPRLGGLQDWCLIDHDAALLAALPARLASWAKQADAVIDDGADALSIAATGFDCRVRIVNADLTASIDTLEIPDGALLSASALLDLVSDAWLEALAARCRRANAVALFALTYDGTMQFQPPEPEDALIATLVNHHQRTDKGFGPALGPTAAARAAEIFGTLGFSVETARSDWHIGHAERAIQQTLLDDWAGAATAFAPETLATVESWANRRRRHIADRSSSMVVGHVDLVAWR